MRDIGLPEKPCSSVCKLCLQSHELFKRHHVPRHNAHSHPRPHENGLRTQCVTKVLKGVKTHANVKQTCKLKGPSALNAHHCVARKHRTGSALLCYGNTKEGMPCETPPESRKKVPNSTMMTDKRQGEQKRNLKADPAWRYPVASRWPVT